MGFRKSLTLLVGSTSVFMIAGLVIVFGLCTGLIQLRYLIDRADSPTKQIPRRPMVYVTFGPTATATPVSGQAALPSANDFAPPADVSVADNTFTSAPLSSDAAALPSADTAPPANTGVGTETPAASLASASTLIATPTLTPTPDPNGTPTTTPTPTLTPTLTPTANSTATQTPTPSSPGRITGSLLLDGAPVSGGVKVKLEDQAYNTIAETSVSADGAYTFADLPPSSEGYTVLFAQEWNSQYEIDEVVSWGWLGPVAVENGEVVELPNFDISLLGFEQVKPEPNATFSAAAVSSANPILFEWAAYPGATKYWVDLVRGEEQNVLWQSSAQATSLEFDGTLGDGTHIQPGEYWWGVGARRQLDSYTLAVYGYLPVLMIEP